MATAQVHIRCALAMAMACALWCCVVPSAARADDGGALIIVDDPHRNSEQDVSQGRDTDWIAVTTPTACPPQTEVHVTTLTKVTARRPADQDKADQWLTFPDFYSPSTVHLPGPLVNYGAAQSMRSMATMHGFTIVPGRYEIATECTDMLRVTVHRRFVGAITFDSPNHFTVDSANRPRPGTPPTWPNRPGEPKIEGPQYAGLTAPPQASSAPGRPSTAPAPAPASPSTSAAEAPTSSATPTTPPAPLAPTSGTSAPENAAPQSISATAERSSTAWPWVVAGLLAVAAVAGALALRRRAQA